MADVIRKMRAGHKTSDIDDTIDEVASAKGTYTTLSDCLNAIESEQESHGAALDEDRAALVELVDSGAKNFIKNTAVSQTINGVEFIVNADKTVTANGTATGNASIAIYIDDANVIGKDMAVSGCPEGGSNTTFRCFLQKNQSNTFTTIATLTGNSVEFVSDIATYRYLITLYNGYTADNLVFSPMLCTKAAWGISHQYVPHRPCYDELIARIEALEGEE